MQIYIVERGTAYLENGKKQVEELGGDATQRAVVDSSLYLLDHLHEVPMMIIPIATIDQAPACLIRPRFEGSVTPGVWSLQLALRARGIGSAWTTLHLYHENEASNLLGIPESVTQIALLPTAYYTGEKFHPAKRRPAEEITYLNRWKQSPTN